MKFLVFFSWVFITPLFGATVVWDGGGTTNNWSDVVNWDCNCLPTLADDVSIPSTYSGATMYADISAQVNSIHSYAGITINFGVSLQVTTSLQLVNGSDLTVNSGATLDVGTYVLLISVSDYTAQIWNSDLLNMGNFSAGEVHMQENCYTGYPCYTTITNNGMMTTDATGVIFDDQSQFINNNSLITTGTYGINMGLSSLLNSFTNNGSLSGATYHNFGNTTNGVDGIISIDNYQNNFNASTNTYEPPLLIRSDFNNLGSIVMTNPQSGALYGVRIGVGATLTSSGSIGITSLRYPMENNGIANISGTTNLQATSSTNPSGVENYGNFNLTNSSTEFTCNKAFNNYASGNLNIASCKLSNLLKLYNLGTTLNNGIVIFDPNNTTTTINQIGTFSNNGIMVNNPFPNTFASGENNGMFIQRVMGDHCSNFLISDFISGNKANISNGPVSGVYLNTGLTLSAGQLQWASNTFTPSSDCINVGTLYLQATLSGCPSQVFPIKFQNPIQSDVWYVDADNDGFGNASTTGSFCGNYVYGYSQVAGDCDDNDASVYPGAPENCNDKDYNCDGIINGSLPAPPTWYQDMDGDGYGNISVSIVSCSNPIGYVNNGTDCNDANSQVYPGAPELCDNIDNDCDGLIDEGLATGTLVFTNAGGNMLWSNPANWSPAIVPMSCFNVQIPTGRTVIASGPSPLQCRSINISNGGTLNINGANLTIFGSTTSGITNNGVINIAPNSTIIISYALMHGINNFGNLSISSTLPDQSINVNINHIGQNAIQNNSAGIFNCTGNTNMLTSAIGNYGLSNSGTFYFRGHWSGFDISNNIFLNSGTLSNYGIIDFQNGNHLPNWTIYNNGTFNNQVGSTILLPSPSSSLNNGKNGIWNSSGATLHNYSNIMVFGNNIAGNGALINYSGSSFSGF